MADTEALEQLERILHRLAMIEEDSKLESVLSKLLPKLVLMLDENASKETIRAKIMEVLSHIIKRVRPNTNVAFDCVGLLEVCQQVDPKAFSFNFSVVFLEIGVPRVRDEAVAVHVLRGLMKGISRLNRDGAQSTFLSLLTTLVSKFKGLPNGEAETQEFNLTAEDSEVISEWFVAMMLFPSGGLAAGVVALAGLSPARSEQLAVYQRAAATAGAGPPPSWPERQLAVLRALHAGALATLLPPAARVPVFLAATVAPHHQVVAAGDNYLRAAAAAAAAAARGAAAAASDADAALAARLLALPVGTLPPALGPQDRLAMGERVLYLNAGPEPTLEEGAVAGVHTEDDPRDPYYTLRFAAAAAGSPPPAAGGRERQTVAAKLRRREGAEWGRVPAGAALAGAALRWLRREAPEAAAGAVGPAVQVIFACLFGPTATPKTKGLGASFAAFLVARASSSALPIISPLMIQAALKVLMDPLSFDPVGGEESAATSTAAGELRASLERAEAREGIYEALASLAHRCPEAVLQLNMVQLLFSLLPRETQALRVRCAAALGGIATALAANQAACNEGRGTVPQALDPDLLLPLLFLAGQNEEGRCRGTALEWVMLLLPFSDPRARAFCLQLSDDPVLTVRIAALKGLDLPTKDEESNQDNMPPDFRDMAALALSPDFQKKISSVEVEANVVQFLSTCLKESVKRRQADFPGVQHLGPEDSGCFSSYLQYIEQRLAGAGAAAGPKAGPLMDALGEALAAALRRAPAPVLAEYAAREAWLRALLTGATRERQRRALAEALGAVAGAFDQGQATACIRALCLAAEHSGAARGGSEGRLGALLGLGRTLAALAIPGAAGGAVHENSSLAGGLGPRAIACIGAQLGAVDLDLHVVACTALGIAGRAMPLPVPDGFEPETGVPVGPHKNVWTVFHLVEVLSGPMALGSAENPRAESAAIALGLLSRGDPSGKWRYQALLALFSRAGKREEEFQFAVGESIKDLALSNRLVVLPSDPVHGQLKDVVAKEGNITEDSGNLFVDIMEYILLRLMWHELENNPHIKGAAGVWLLAVVAGARKACEEENISIPLGLQRRLLEIQTAFTRLLNERSEFTQEVAGKGLALVFEVANESQKKQLLESLVGALSTGSRRGASNIVSLHGTTPDGAALSDAGASAYREMCAVATDVGRPDLVYSFLALASHHSAWNTRRGAGFGLAQILQGGMADALRPHLAGLVPRLLRYRHDPSAKVREAMDALWGTVVPDTKVAIKEHFENILKELWVALNSRKWRERQGAASALEDVLSGKSFEQTAHWLERLWGLGLRVVDDIKESVREAALGFVKTLASLTCRLADRSQTPPQESEACIKIMLPFLLQKGILDKCAISQGIAMGVLQKIIKVAGASLKLYLADTIAVLIEGMGALEPQALQYMQFHAESQENMEQLRLTMARASPLQDSLDHCTKQIDDDVAREVLPKLLNLLRTGVGLPTRSASAYLVLNLCERSPREVGRRSSALLQQLAASALAERRSATLRSALAGAMGSVARLASPFDVGRLARRLVRLYRASDSFSMDSTHKLSVMQLLSSLCLRASSQVMDAWASVLPICYIGKHDADEKIAQHSEEIWIEGVSQYGGEMGTLTSLLERMMIEIKNALAALSWVRRRQGAVCLQKLCQALQDAFEPKAKVSIYLLLRMLPGKMWDGKECILETLVKVCACCPNSINFESDEDLPLLTAAGALCSDEAEEDQAEVSDQAREHNAVDDEAGTTGQAQCEESADQPVAENPDLVAILQEVDESENDQNGQGLESLTLQIEYIPFRGMILFLLQQSTRPHKAMARAALSALRDLLEAFPYHGSRPIYLTIKPQLFVLAGFGSTDIPANLDPILQARAIECLGKAWPGFTPLQKSVGSSTFKMYDENILQIAIQSTAAAQKESIKDHITVLAMFMDKMVWPCRVAALEALTHCFEEAYVQGDPYSIEGEPDTYITGSMITSLVKAATFGMSDGKYAKVRRAAMGALAALVRRGGPGVGSGGTTRGIHLAAAPRTEEIMALSRQAREDSDPQVISHGKMTLDILHTW